MSRDFDIFARCMKKRPDIGNETFEIAAARSLSSVFCLIYSGNGPRMRRPRGFRRDRGWVGRD